jgi:hypothetical protein
VTAARYPIVIEQGSTWDPVLTVRDTDLTGYTARMQIRAAVDAPDVLVDLSTTNGRITIDGPAGRIKPLLTDVDTAALTWKQGVYDLELVSPSGHVDRLLQGTVTIDPEVTR